MRESIGAKDSFALHTQLTSEVLPGQFLVELIAGNRLLVEYHKGLVSFDNERIVVKVRRGSVVILGSGMTVDRMLKQQVWISGSIQSINFERG